MTGDARSRGAGGQVDLRRWRRAQDALSLGEQAAEFEGHLPLLLFRRLAAAFAAPEDAPLIDDARHGVDARLVFSRQQQWTRLVVDAELVMPLRCQRCLEVYEHTLAVTTRVALVDDEAVEALVPDELETMVCSRHVRPLDLLEDELIMAVPLVPTHPDPADCGEVADWLEAPAPEEPA